MMKQADNLYIALYHSLNQMQKYTIFKEIFREEKKLIHLDGEHNMIVSSFFEKNTLVPSDSWQ